MYPESPLSALLEVLARSQRELERFEADRERSRPIKEQVESLLSGAGLGHEARDPIDAQKARDESLRVTSL